MESVTELAWFRGEVWRSLVRPREFARELAREHFGLAGVLLAVLSGIAFSLGIDLLVLTTKGLAPADFVPRLLLDAGLLGVRLAISAAAVAWLTAGALRLLRRAPAPLEQVFNALTFALAPLLFVPVPALFVIVAPEGAMLALGTAVVLVLVIRVLAGIVLNIRSIFSSTMAAAALVLVALLGSLVLSDQITHLRFLAYAVAPPLVPDLAAAPAQGRRYEMLGFDLTVPSGWDIANTGVPGEAARFESATATLVVQRARGSALSTADSYADTVVGQQLLGMQGTWHERSVERIDGIVMVDDRYGGTYGGRSVVWRQFTAVPRTTGLALVYRVVEPPDRGAALAEAASIAAAWHIATGP